MFEYIENYVKSVVLSLAYTLNAVFWKYEHHFRDIHTDFSAVAYKTMHSLNCSVLSPSIPINKRGLSPSIPKYKRSPLNFAISFF